MFKPSFILLPIEIDLILEKQSFKNDIFMALSLNNFKIIYALLIEVQILHMQVSKV